MFTNNQFPQRPVIAPFDENLECAFCGRDYGDSTAEEAAVLRATGCRSEECPSHWEEQGLPNPNYYNVAYKRYDTLNEAAFLTFWEQFPEGKKLRGGSDEQEAFFEAHIPEWNRRHEERATQSG